MALSAPQPQQWRTQQAIAMQRADKQVLAQLRASQTALNAQLKAIASRTGFSNRIREAQLRLAKREIQLQMANLFRKIGDITSATRLEAAARVLNVNKQLDTFKLLGAGLPDGAEVAQAIADAELDAARSGLDRMLARVQGSSYTPLSQRVYTAASGLNGPISTLVNNALAAGLSAREFASAAKDFINPMTPGGVRYAAYRLARTEINNSAHALAVHSVQEKPWVTGMRWHLSGSHPRVDICNSLASGGPKGDGVYPKAGVPAKPHPQCFCFVTPETPDDEEFLDSLVDGHYDEYLERYRNIQPGQIISTKPFSGTRPPAPRTPTALPGGKAAEGVRKVRATAPSKTERLRRSIATGIKERVRVGGLSAEATERVVFNDGTKAIKKTMRETSFSHGVGKLEGDAEELGNVLSSAMGFETPALVRTGEREMYFEFMDGRLAAELADEGDSLLLSPEGIKLRLMDLLMVNSDRNPGNFLVRERILQPIDNGMSFLDWDALDGRAIGSAPDWGQDPLSVFAREADFRSGRLRIPSDWIDNPLSQADVAKLRGILASIRPDFIRLKHKDWYDSMLKRFENIASHARGRENIL